MHAAGLASLHMWLHSADSPGPMDSRQIHWPLRRNDFPLTNFSHPLCSWFVRKRHPAFPMDIPATIDLYKTALLRIIAGLFAMLEAAQADRKSTRLNSSHIPLSRMPSSA